MTNGPFSHGVLTRRYCGPGFERFALRIRVAVVNAFLKIGRQAKRNTSGETPFSDRFSAFSRREVCCFNAAVLSITKGMVATSTEPITHNKHLINCHSVMFRDIANCVPIIAMLFVWPVKLWELLGTPTSRGGGQIREWGTVLCVSLCIG